jgi:hypothetical protein
VEVGWRLAVVAYRDTQNVQRHNLSINISPWPVVPSAGIPVILLENPVHAIVKKQVYVLSRRVVDRVTGHNDKFRI